MSQDVMVTNKTSGIVPIPTLYGGGNISPSDYIIINDTLANVQASFSLTTNKSPSGTGGLQYALVPAGQTAITPATNSGKTQVGTATLVAGTKTVTGVVITANSKIVLTRDTPGGTVGDLSAPAASRSIGSGQFVINSANAADTSTIDWLIIG